jgi:hypothetical protein
MPSERSGRPEFFPAVHGVCGTSLMKLAGGYVRQIEIVGDDRSSSWKGLGLDRCG